MNLKLTRTKSALYGIEGTLASDDQSWKCFTLEHAFSIPLEGSTIYQPKLSPGLYTCKRGTHELKNGTVFETFEITNVPRFLGYPVTKILLHWGNYNKNSDGCVLLGLEMGTGCILESKKAFDAFMALQVGINEFTLMVS